MAVYNMNQCETCGKPSQTYKIVGNMRQGKTTAKHLCYPCADKPLREQAKDNQDMASFGNYYNPEGQDETNIMDRC